MNRPKSGTPEYSRIRYLPEQLRAARLKVKMLEREAARLGMHDLLEGGGDAR